ncbi:MAG: hypothetical protein A2V66_02690 [Ignavibacteria bacterium RBG_13_36_8]|nr:MAG: hypothetical protein A2V66_02690 [Ignavibacteria bacterium RBG_13_36_8]
MEISIFGNKKSIKIFFALFSFCIAVSLSFPWKFYIPNFSDNFSNSEVLFSESTTAQPQISFHAGKKISKTFSNFDKTYCSRSISYERRTLKYIRQQNSSIASFAPQIMHQSFLSSHFTSDM